MLLYITYGDIETAESMKTTTLLQRLFFTSYVMMSDLKYQACRKWKIIMLTEHGVRGGHSLSLFLARAETILMIDGHLHWCGPIAVGSLDALSWPLGGSWFVFPVLGMWGCFVWFCLFSPGYGVLLGCFVWLCPYVGVGFCFSGLIGCLSWLCPYVGDWFLVIRCFFVSG